MKILQPTTALRIWDFGLRIVAQSGLKPVYRLLFLTFIIHHSSFIISKAQLNLSSCACLADLPDGAGSFYGKTCFDIALSNDNTSCELLSRRIDRKADFTQASTNTQVYTYTPSGTVSKVRFSFEDLEGLAIQSITPNSPTYQTGLNINTPCTVTVVYKNNLNTTALGRTRATAIKPKLFVIYNNNASGFGSDNKLELTADIKDCACCGAPTNTGAWLEFMCYNLGAEHRTDLDPFVYNGAAIDEDYYQWGRAQDGHERSTSSNTGALSNSDIPGHGWFIAALSAPNNWRSPANEILWGNVKTATDPCPAGYKVPSIFQWESIYTGITANWVWTGNGYKIGSSLYLPADGRRYYGDVMTYHVGNEGHYWSSTTAVQQQSRYLFFANGLVNLTRTEGRADGKSVRCVAE